MQRISKLFQRFRAKKIRGAIDKKTDCEEYLFRDISYQVQIDAQL